MKKHYSLITLLLPLFFLTANAQNNLPTEGPAFYFNSFQHYKDKNVDSALFFARKLTVNNNYLPRLEDLLHNSYAQAFLPMWEKKKMDSTKRQLYKNMQASARKLLPAMMADDNPHLKKAVMPIYYWTQVQENENENKRLEELVTEFIKTKLSTNDLYSNRVGRYALLIYQVIAPKKSLQPTTEKLLKSLVDNLKNNQVNADANTPRPLLAKRAWYRYLYAYLNSMQGNSLLAENKIKEAGPYLKTAFEYSPDIIDINVRSGYFYEVVFLTEKQEVTFRDDYISYLTKHSGDKQETLSALLSTALVNPAMKDQLKSYYNSNFSDQENFTAYWVKSINEKAQKAPAVSLLLMDGTKFSLSKHKDKWILLDFWGTWCGPCRKEHPEIEKFYNTVKSASTDKITFLTIACKDSEDKVTNYMTGNKYTFPVAMSNEVIEKIYKINSYPSKILISPQGKYIVIPFGSDWVDFVKKYADL